MAREPPKLWPPLGTANLALPCGKCIGCKTAKATEWAERCSHEAKKYTNNTFITLTYEDNYLPNEGWLDADEFTRFLKRLRKRAEYDRNIVCDSRFGIRYFACGEYGEKTARPHYHAILFNADFADKQRVGKNLYHSDILRSLWPYGHNRVGDASPAAASYIAQYALKKQGDGSTDADGVWKPAPFLRMSRNLGKDWLEQNQQDLEKGFFVRDGKPRKIPRTYLLRIKEKNGFLYDAIQANQQKFTRGDHNARLEAAEIIHKRRKELSEARKL